MRIEVLARREERLPHLAVPRYAKVAPKLPRTPTGKATKYALRERGLGEPARDRGSLVGGVQRAAPTDGG